MVLIAFAGGVRTRETFGTPANVPSLRQMADAGVHSPNVATTNLGHFGATKSIFTGISEPRGIRENARGNDPTLFEYLRKGLALPKQEVWVTTTGGAQQVNYSYSLHPEYGVKYGANILDGDGIFNKEFKDLLNDWGMPQPVEARERALLDRLRRGVGGGEDAAREAEQLARVEDYILGELSRGTTDISGAAAGDRKALRLARNLLSLFKPRMLGVVLQNADVAHGSFNAYSEVVRQSDAAIGELMTAIREDEELRDRGPGGPRVRARPRPEQPPGSRPRRRFGRPAARELRRLGAGLQERRRERPRPARHRRGRHRLRRLRDRGPARQGRSPPGPLRLTPSMDRIPSRMRWLALAVGLALTGLVERVPAAGSRGRGTLVGAHR